MQHVHLDHIHTDVLQHRINLVTPHRGWYTVVGHCLPWDRSARKQLTTPLIELLIIHDITTT
jgi:hypothetical protein